MDVTKLQNALGAGDWATAEAILSPVARQPGAHPSLVYNYGKVLLEQARGPEAVAVLAQVVRAVPEHGDAWFELGRAALLIGDFSQAEAAFERALKLAPQDRDAQRNLARILLRRGKFARAEALWRQLAGQSDAEAELALYRTAVELGHEDAASRRAALLRDHPDPQAVFTTLTRVAKGALPLRLGPEASIDLNT